MIKILFVCHGNICRSPMAEFVLKDMVQKRGLGDCFYIASEATSTEEIGNPVHHGTRNKLREVGISCAGKHAVQMKKSDYQKYDYIVGSDPEGKVKLLLDYSSQPRDIADPWYTGNFEVTYSDIVEGCEAFLKYLAESGKFPASY